MDPTVLISGNSFGLDYKYIHNENRRKKYRSGRFPDNIDFVRASVLKEPKITRGINAI